MHCDDVPITTPCDADWSTMSPTETRARLCAACDKVVHDLSAMDEREVRAVLRDGPACVRYVYDLHGRIVLGGVPDGARVVPAGSLLSKAAKNKWLRVAAVAATAIVFEACGGNNGGFGESAESRDAGARDELEKDAGTSPAPKVEADGGVGDDGSVDASDAAETDGG
jgi:hypothetical protein